MALSLGGVGPARGIRSLATLAYTKHQEEICSKGKGSTCIMQALATQFSELRLGKGLRLPEQRFTKCSCCSRMPQISVLPRFPAYY